MASDWQEVTTSFKDPSTGAAFTGYLLATMAVDKVLLANGGYLSAYRYKFAVTAGQAYMADGVTELILPITEDANPVNAPIFLSLMDTHGRITPYGYVVIPRPASTDPYPAVDLDDHLTV